MDLFNLKDKVALITGGAGVLGGSMGKALAVAGCKIAVLDRDQAKLDDFVKELAQSGYTAIGVKTDVLDKANLEAARDQILDRFGTIDILLNCAGGNQPGATIQPDQTFFDLSLEDLDKVMALNLKGTILPIMVFGEVMAKNKKGSIINMSSMSAQQALTRVFGYSASKAGIDNITRWLAVEMAQKFGEGIRINAIAPGFFIGEQNRRLLLNEDGSWTDRAKTIIKATPMGRFGEAEELQGVLIWLASDASSFVTGTVVAVDGGFGAFSGV